MIAGIPVALCASRRRAHGRNQRYCQGDRVKRSDRQCRERRKTRRGFVWPTIEEPLRDDWDLVRAEVQTLLNGYVRAPAILERIDDYIVPPGLGGRAGVLGAIALAQDLG